MNNEEILVVQSKIKSYIRSINLNSSGDLAEGLSRVVRKVLNNAAERAKADGRKTIRIIDLHE